MFNFFKDKLKKAVSSISKKVDELPDEEIDAKEVIESNQSQTEEREELNQTEVEETPKEAVEPKETKEELKEPLEDSLIKIPKEDDPKPQEPDLKEIKEPEIKEPIEESTKKKGIFQKIFSKKIDASTFEELFFDLELVLLENNISIEVVEKIKEDLKKELLEKPIQRGKVLETIEKSLRQSIDSILSIPKLEFPNKTPLIICLVGINGSGKTTSIAKLTKYFQNQGKSVVLAAADTFRAAAIEQLQEHADKLNVKLIRHQYKSDAAAVAFDAVKHAKAKGLDVVLIDTAGRIQSNENLMNEMKKIVKIASPHLKIFVGESITGNDCVDQARKFDEIIGIDGIILSKADIDEKGGSAISIAYVTKKPIVFLGVGQEYEDLEEFDKEKVLSILFK